MTNRVSDRRNLNSEPSKPVLKIWKEVATRKLAKAAGETERIIESLIMNHRMCRKCYTSYDRLNRMQKSVEDSFDEALSVLLPEVRRKRQTSSCSGSSSDSLVPASKRIPQPPLVAVDPVIGKSPVVSVSVVKFIIQSKVVMTFYMNVHFIMHLGKYI